MLQVKKVLRIVAIWPIPSRAMGSYRERVAEPPVHYSTQSQRTHSASVLAGATGNVRPKSTNRKQPKLFPDTRMRGKGLSRTRRRWRRRWTKRRTPTESVPTDAQKPKLRLNRHLKATVGPAAMAGWVEPFGHQPTSRKSPVSSPCHRSPWIVSGIFNLFKHLI